MNLDLDRISSHTALRVGKALYDHSTGERTLTSMAAAFCAHHARRAVTLVQLIVVAFTAANMLACVALAVVGDGWQSVLMWAIGLFWLTVTSANLLAIPWIWFGRLPRELEAELEAWMRSKAQIAAVTSAIVR